MHILRIARPTDSLDEMATLYMQGLGLQKIGSFQDHDGFDGVMLGHSEGPYHLEFTTHSNQPAVHHSTSEHLLIFYIPEYDEWFTACERMEAAGFVPVSAMNPYWERKGRTFIDPDGYRVVLQNQTWPA